MFNFLMIEYDILVHGFTFFKDKNRFFIFCDSLM